jgi:transcriptional regulator with XRE-family HTH domain
MIYKLIGWYLKRQRIKRGLTLREFCIRQEYDASTISRLERGYYFKIAPEYEHIIRGSNERGYYLGVMPRKSNGIDK